MCGFCGEIRFDDGLIDLGALGSMNASMSSRGPDGHGVFNQGHIALAHRRLSIIDLSGGHQPLFNEDGSVAVVYNGEIYNFHELTEELLAAGQ